MRYVFALRRHPEDANTQKETTTSQKKNKHTLGRNTETTLSFVGGGVTADTQAFYSRYADNARRANARRSEGGESLKHACVSSLKRAQFGDSL